MLFTRYQAADAFLARAQTRLERREAANNLIVSIAIRLKEHPDRIKTPPYLATVEDGDALVAAAVMTPPHRVIVHGPEGSTGPIPLKMIAEDLIAANLTPPGVIGPAEAARAFGETWKAARGCQVKLHQHLRIYDLHRVTPPLGVPGALRVATEADLDFLPRWVYDFHRDAGLATTIEAAQETAEVRVGDRDLFLWDVAPGQPVSMAAKARHSTHGIIVSLVYTPPDFRRHGYAGACVAALSQQLLDAGWDWCALFTNLANPISNSIYQKIGYRPVCDFDEYVFE